MKVIDLISSPRNLSTALILSFAQRKDTSVMDKLFYGNYLYRSDAGPSEQAGDPAKYAHGP